MSLALRYAALVSLVLWSLPILGQDQASPIRLERLKSSDWTVRQKVSHDFYGAGIRDTETTDAIATLITTYLSHPKLSEELQEEIYSHLFALASSGNIKYMATIELAKRHADRHVSRYARDAEEMLSETSKARRPLILPEKVTLITEMQASQCALIGQESCEDRGGSIDSCTDELRQAVVDSGGDSLMLMNQSSGGGWFGVASVMANLYRCTAEEID